MSPYRLKYNESESDIKNYNFLYKNTKKAKTLSKKTIFFDFLGFGGKISKIQNFQKPKFLFCILYTFHNSYFLLFFSTYNCFRKNGNFKNPKFSKSQICILHSVHIPQFIFFISFLTYNCFWKTLKYIFISLYNYLIFIFIYIFIFLYFYN